MNSKKNMMNTSSLLTPRRRRRRQEAIGTTSMLAVIGTLLAFSIPATGRTSTAFAHRRTAKSSGRPAVLSFWSSRAGRSEPNGELNNLLMAPTLYPTMVTKRMYHQSDNDSEPRIEPPLSGNRLALPLLPRRQEQYVAPRKTPVSSPECTYLTQSTTSTRSHTSFVDRPKAFHIYCDLDGVLVDFAHGISHLYSTDETHNNKVWTSQNIDALPRRQLWDKVKSADSFFEKLPWCPGGQELWNAIAPLRPDILTGVPSYCSWTPRAEKLAWCERELGNHKYDSTVASPPNKFVHLDKAGPLRMHYPVNLQTDNANLSRGRIRSRSVNVGRPRQQQNDRRDEAWHCTVITCWSEQKHHESGPGIVLIDDRIDLRAAWEAKGGIFIHHITGDVENTLRQLRHHGILPHDEHQPTTDSFEGVWQSTMIRP